MLAAGSTWLASLVAGIICPTSSKWGLLPLMQLIACVSPTPQIIMGETKRTTTLSYDNLVPSSKLFLF